MDDCTIIYRKSLETSELAKRLMQGGWFHGEGGYSENHSLKEKLQTVEHGGLKSQLTY